MGFWNPNEWLYWKAVIRIPLEGEEASDPGMVLQAVWSEVPIIPGCPLAIALKSQLPKLEQLKKSVDLLFKNQSILKIEEPKRWNQIVG